MDDLAKYNQTRWEELVRADVEFSRPFLDLDEQSARTVVDPYGIMGQVAGKTVLCLASGGGQQSVAFALLGAEVTVFDLTPGQLAQDQKAAAHYGLPVTTVQGDMRDLSPFADDAFDIVWHAHSINFVPDIRPVLREVRRVLGQGGLYRLEYHNPFTQAVDEVWTESGYGLKHPYVDGAEVTTIFPHWDVQAEDGTTQRVDSPRAFRHALSTVTNRMIEYGFVILGIWEAIGDNLEAEPGTWDHFLVVAPPYLTCWATYRPDFYASGVPKLHFGKEGKGG